MKKNILIVGLAVFFQMNRVQAQNTTATTSDFKVLGSYRALLDFDVHPYFKHVKTSSQVTAGVGAAASGNAGQSPTPSTTNNNTLSNGLVKTSTYAQPDTYIDPNIYFTVKAGTEFYIIETKGENGSITGYVIKVWDFDANSQEKQAFYDNLPNITKTSNANPDKKPWIISLSTDSLKLNSNNKYELSPTLFSLAKQQSSNPKFDDKDYKKLKKNDKGEYDLTVTDSLSPYAKYAQLAYLDSWANDKEFFASASDITRSATSVYPSSLKFTWGFLTLPIKLRFDNNRGGRFNFEQNLNFGLTFGAKQQLVKHDDVSMNYLVGVSVVNAPLNDAISATPEIPATSTTAAVPAKAASPATSAAALSISIGSMFQYNKFQIGLFLGRDFVGDNSNKFSFQGRTWLGIAIGVSLFGEGQTTATGQKQN